MGLFDIFRSRKQDDNAPSSITLKKPAWAAIFKSRKKDDLAEKACLHVFQRFDDVTPHFDKILGLQVLAEVFVEPGVEHESKGFKLGLIKNRAFFGVFMAGAFNARHRADKSRFALLLQTISGAALNGLVDGLGPDAVGRGEIVPDLNRFMLEVSREGSGVLSSPGGFLSTLSDDRHTFDATPLKPIHDLYHEVYRDCFGPSRYFDITEGEQSFA